MRGRVRLALFLGRVRLRGRRSVQIDHFCVRVAVTDQKRAMTLPTNP